MESSNNFPGQALNYNVIIREEKTKNLTSGGLDLSSATEKNEKYRKGTVLSIGNLIESELSDSKIKEGSTVMYDNYKSSDITIDGVTYKSVVYSDLLLVL